MLPVLQKLPCTQTVWRFYADDTHKMTPMPALTVASQWEMIQLSLDTMQSMTKFGVPLRMAPKLDPVAFRSSFALAPTAGRLELRL